MEGILFIALKDLQLKYLGCYNLKELEWIGKGLGK